MTLEKKQDEAPAKKPEPAVETHSQAAQPQAAHPQAELKPTHKADPSPDYTVALNGKTVQSLTTSKRGSVQLVDILCTDKNHFYIKFMQGVEEFGGTDEWGTGTRLGGQ